MKGSHGEDPEGPWAGSGWALISRSGCRDLISIRLSQARQSSLQGRSDLLVGLPQGIIGQMSITLGGQDFGVAEQLADDGEVLSRVDPETGEGMPEIVDPDVLNLGGFADAIPQPLKSAEVRSRFGTGDDIGIAVDPFEVREDLDRPRIEPDSFAARFAIG